MRKFLLAAGSVRAAGIDGIAKQGYNYNRQVKKHPLSQGREEGGDLIL
jgi:hypothetical protein